MSPQDKIVKLIDSENSSIEASVSQLGSQGAVNVTILDSAGNITSPSSMITVPYDYIGATYPDTSTEVYTYKSGGASGTVVGTITVVFSDAVTKQIILSVTKT